MEKYNLTEITKEHDGIYNATIIDAIFPNNVMFLIFKFESSKFENLGMGLKLSAEKEEEVAKSMSILKMVCVACDYDGIVQPIYCFGKDLVLEIKDGVFVSVKKK